MHKLPGGEHAPALLAVKFLGSDDDRRGCIQRRDVHRGRCAADVQPGLARAGAGRPLDDVQGMLSRIAQRPQLTRRGDDGVQ